MSLKNPHDGMFPPGVSPAILLTPDNNVGSKDGVLCIADPRLYIFVRDLVNNDVQSQQPPIPPTPDTDFQGPADSRFNMN